MLFRSAMPLAVALAVELGCAVADWGKEAELSLDSLESGGAALDPEVDGVTTTDDDGNDDVDEDAEEEGVWLWLSGE